MKILLAPAETKRSGGDLSEISKNSFIFEELYEKRLEIITQYEELLKRNSIEELSAWFGLKKESEVIRYQESVLEKPGMKAIQRYTGVAFDYLGYDDLNEKEKNYCDTNVLLFSNLFGPIQASDIIPDYKFKQGAKLPNTVVEKFYKENFSAALDQYLGEEIIDLRAGFYDKFYTPKSPYVTMKFIKEGKVVSHWAKAYRGIVLKHLALNNIQTTQELMQMNIPNLHVQEIKKIKNKTEIIYTIDT
ncbi:MAG: YaaA family protein [Campylobacterota bacterium]|nr:YaaA family protein [Campylobacterota bacterium]